MTTSPVGLTAVRLGDVPLPLRESAAGPLIAAARKDGKLLDAIEIQRAVRAPSDRVYFVPTDAVADVLGTPP